MYRVKSPRIIPLYLSIIFWLLILPRELPAQTYYHQPFYYLLIVNIHPRWVGAPPSKTAFYYLLIVNTGTLFKSILKSEQYLSIIFWLLMRELIIVHTVLVLKTPFYYLLIVNTESFKNLENFVTQTFYYLLIVNTDVDITSQLPSDIAFLLSFDC